MATAHNVFSSTPWGLVGTTHIHQWMISKYNLRKRLFSNLPYSAFLTRLLDSNPLTPDVVDKLEVAEVKRLGGLLRPPAEFCNLLRFPSWPRKYLDLENERRRKDRGSYHDYRNWRKKYKGSKNFRKGQYKGNKPFNKPDHRPQDNSGSASGADRSRGEHYRGFSQRRQVSGKAGRGSRFRGRYARGGRGRF